LINNSNILVEDIPLSVVDPIHLARSQKDSLWGFILVCYPGMSSESSYFDIYFVSKSTIVDICRMTPDFRFRLRIKDALSKLRHHRENDIPASVYLFESNQDIFNTFRSTFYLEPCLKIHTAILANTTVSLGNFDICSKGILECNQFHSDKFDIHLDQIDSLDNFSIGDSTSFNYTGRLLIYDIEKNNDILREKYFGRLDDLDTTLSHHLELAENSEKSNLLSNSLSFENNLIDNYSPPDIQNKEVSNNNQSNDNDNSPDSIVSQFDSMLSGLKNNGDIEQENSDSSITSISDHISESTESSSEDSGSMSAEDVLKSSFESFYSDFVEHLSKEFDKYNKYLYPAINDIKAKYANISNTDLDFDDLNIPTGYYHIVFEIAFECVRNIYNPFRLKKRKSLQSYLSKTLSDFYNKRYDLLKEFRLLDDLEKIHSEYS